MKNLTILSFLLLSIISFSQYKLTYEYTYYYDSLRPSKVYNYEMDVIKTSTDRFYFEKNKIKSIEVDYLGWKNNEDPQIIWNKQNSIPSTKLNNYLIEDNKGNIEIFHSYLERYFFKISLPNSSNWILKNESENHLKKATINFLNRNWIAYYDENIPINDGPFIFRGLPGLIVELQDEQGYFKWKLTSYTIDYDDKNYTRELLNFRLPKANKINEKDFKKTMIDDFYNPGSAIQSTGIVVEEENIKRMIDFQKTQIHRFLIPDLWTYL